MLISRGYTRLEVGREKDDTPQDRFDKLIEESVVLDIDRAMGLEEFCNLVADAMSTRLNQKPEVLFKLLIDRERERGWLGDQSRLSHTSHHYRRRTDVQYPCHPL